MEWGEREEGREEGGGERGQLSVVVVGVGWVLDAAAAAAAAGGPPTATTTTTTTTTTNYYYHHYYHSLTTTDVVAVNSRVRGARAAVSGFPV